MVDFTELSLLRFPDKDIRGYLQMESCRYKGNYIKNIEGYIPELGRIDFLG